MFFPEPWHIAYKQPQLLYDHHLRLMVQAAQFAYQRDDESDDLPLFLVLPQYPQGEWWLQSALVTRLLMIHNIQHIVLLAPHQEKNYQTIVPYTSKTPLILWHRYVQDKDLCQALYTNLNLPRFTKRKLTGDESIHHWLSFLTLIEDIKTISVVASYEWIHDNDMYQTIQQHHKHKQICLIIHPHIKWSKSQDTREEEDSSILHFVEKTNKIVKTLSAHHKDIRMPLWWSWR